MRFTHYASDHRGFYSVVEPEKFIEYSVVLLLG